MAATGLYSRKHCDILSFASMFRRNPLRTFDSCLKWPREMFWTRNKNKASQWDPNTSEEPTNERRPFCRHEIHSHTWFPKHGCIKICSVPKGRFEASYKISAKDFDRICVCAIRNFRPENKSDPEIECWTQKVTQPRWLTHWAIRFRGVREGIYNLAYSSPFSLVRWWFRAPQYTKLRRAYAVPFVQELSPRYIPSAPFFLLKLHGCGWSLSEALSRGMALDVFPPSTAWDRAERDGREGKREGERELYDLHFRCEIRSRRIS